MTQSTWFNRWKTTANAKIRLYCIPHAGAGTSAIKALTTAAPEWFDVVAVRLPGRETRFLEELPESIEQVAEELAAEIKQEAAESDVPFLLMGQCSGAVIAYETVAKLGSDLPQLQGLVVCSRPAPSIVVKEVNLDLDDNDLIEEVIKIGGFDPEIIVEPMLMELLAPVLRGDIALVKGYVRSPEVKLCVPVLAVRGVDDAMVPVEQLQGWQQFTTDTFTIGEVSAGHFLFDEVPTELLALVESFVEANANKKA
ncbi:MAG: hypothetical protein K6T83_06190 [Alicyclobacillus sp.]|nr:hypothetical protein [Alicyclobacillus sp.]